jgi:hypothetical protein
LFRFRLENILKIIVCIGNIFFVQETMVLKEKLFNFLSKSVGPFNNYDRKQQFLDNEQASSLLVI